ncbi:YdeI/OmpD-associated family protein [Nocardioides sp. Bht2]|uniref:YdeI/OmpD-associated family protein n=1 Tax=Nocardioides sp. Bht2 TaxID=3392297 RepID=UPI0039B3C1F8
MSANDTSGFEIDGEPALDLPSRAEFERWLTDAAEEVRAVWLRTAKKSSQLTSITEDETVDVGLCFGWVSAVRRKWDDDTYVQRYTRRRPRSKWSRINIAKVERLTAEGRMRPAGLAEVDAAKADGRWDNPWT